MGDLDKIWDKVRGPLGSIAPLLGTVIGGPGGAAVGSLVANVLKVKDEPESIAKALESVTPNQRAELIKLQEDNRHELAKLTLQKAVSDNERDAKTISEVNQSIRVEAQQPDTWAGKWRPFWGFTSAIAFFVAVTGLIFLAGYAIKTRQLELLGHIPTLTFQLAALFAIPGAILGVASWHRGKKQRIEAGETAKPTFVDALVSRVIK
jgi:hypothetical protein